MELPSLTAPRAWVEQVLRARPRSVEGMHTLLSLQVADQNWQDAEATLRTWLTLPTSVDHLLWAQYECCRVFRAFIQGGQKALLGRLLAESPFEGWDDIRAPI